MLLEEDEIIAVTSTLHNQLETILGKFIMEDSTAIWNGISELYLRGYVLFKYNNVETRIPFVYDRLQDRIISCDNHIITKEMLLCGKKE